MWQDPDTADAIVVGAGLAGLVAACELVDAGRRVLVVDQEPEASLGGQAFWSLGGLFLVDSPEQRRMGIRDSYALALRDWMTTAGFHRPEDHWPRRWAEAFVAFAAGEMRGWLRHMGLRFFPVVGWAERGGRLATDPGNSVPRFHITWGTGPGVLEPFLVRALRARDAGLLRFRFRHCVTALEMHAGAVAGVAGEVLAASDARRGTESSRDVVGDFRLSAPVVIVASGGMGGSLERVRRHWPEHLGSPPQELLSGVPHHVDGAMLDVAEAAGARLINRDRMWHYTEGVQNWDPIWPRHGIRILPGPSSLWLDADGRRLPSPHYPGCDTLGALGHIRRRGHEHTWFVLTRAIIEKEFALSGSEQNPDLTGRSWRKVLGRVLPGAPGPVAAFMARGADFVLAADLDRLVRGMNELTPEDRLSVDTVRREVEARDAQLDNHFGKDGQLALIRSARAYRGDRWLRVARPHRFLDRRAGPLVAVRLRVLTRKTLGGLETDLSGQVLGPGGHPVSGLFAVGEAAGFGGGGMHGNRALEGTFLGGCLFTGRVVGRAASGR